MRNSLGVLLAFAALAVPAGDACYLSNANDTVDGTDATGDGGAVDAAPETASDSAGDASPDDTGDGEVPEPPAIGASCDELAAWVRTYAEAHDDCTTDDECEAAVEIGGRTCEYAWVEYSRDDHLLVGVRRDAVDDNFESARSRLAGCCQFPMWGGGTGWECAGLWDAPFVSLRATCPDRICVAEPAVGPESCM